MPQSKRSPIWKMSKEDFTKLIINSKSYTEVLKVFGLGIHGNNHNTIRRRCSEDHINLDHFMAFARLSRIKKPRSLVEVQVKNSTYSRSNLKTRLLREGLLENKCSICGLNNKWNGKSISLILDHENGIPNDHRMENLRMVCPNCNSQLDTFAGKHKRSKERTNCKSCGRILAKRSKKELCLSCAMSKRRKIVWPSLEELQIEIAKSNRFQVSKKLGVSETAVRKMLKRMKQNIGPSSSD